MPTCVQKMSSGEQDSATTAAHTEEEGESTATSEQQEDSSAKPEQTSEERDGEKDAKEKEDATSEPEKASPLEEKIIRQVEVSTINQSREETVN